MTMRIILIVCYFITYGTTTIAASTDECSPEKMRHFLQHDYNTLSYRKTVLPNDFGYMKSLIRHGKTTNKNQAYCQAIIRLFGNGLKSSMYVNASALNDLLQDLPDSMEHYFLTYKNSFFSSLKEHIYSLLLSRFTSQFNIFKKEPRSFLDVLAQEIIEAIEKDENTLNDIPTHELRSTIMGFLELSLGKLVWSPHDGIETWESVKAIAHNIIRFADCNIIDDPDKLNDLFITLVERYCLFLDINSTQIEANVYQQIKQDVTSQLFLFLEFEEQEEGILTKSEILLRAVLQGEALLRAEQISN